MEKKNDDFKVMFFIQENIRNSYPTKSFTTTKQVSDFKIF